MSMWEDHKLRMTFATPLCGSVPRYDKIVDDWVRMRAASAAEYQALRDHPPGPEARAPQSLDKCVEERVATLDKLNEEVEEATQKVWVGFSRDEHGLFVRGANLRAHLKDCATVLGKVLRQEKHDLGGRPVKQFAAKLKDALYIAEERLYVRDAAGVPYGQATGHREATLNVMTAQGPRTCLKRVDYCMPAVIEATVQLLGGTEISLRHVKLCLEYGAVHGFGQDRSLQFGRYEWALDE